MSRTADRVLNQQLPTVARGTCAPGVASVAAGLRRSAVLVALPPTVAAGAVAWLFRDFNFDDAYIVARYATNLAAGQGWVFNPGEVHNGATSPLFTLLVALAARLGLDPLLAGHWLAVGALAAAAALTALLLRAGGFALGGLVAGLLLATAPLPHLTVGLETTLYLALLTGGLLAYHASRHALAGLLLGLLALTRGDGLLALGVVGAHLAWSVRRARAHEAGPTPGALGAFGVAAAVPLGLWCAWAIPALGSPLPATLAAKVAHVRSGLWQERPGNLFVDWTLIWLRIFMGPPPALYPFALLGLVALLGRLGRQGTGPTLLLGPAAVALYVAAYAALGVVTYHWYVAPLLWALCLLAGAGADSLWCRLSALTLRPGRPSWQAGVRAGLAGLLVVGSVGVNVPALGIAVVREARDPRDVAYSTAGDWLRRHAPAGSSFAAVEAGTIAYRSGLRAIDPLGLVSPGLAERLAEGDTIGWLSATWPDYVVLHEPPVLLESELLALPEFLMHYAPRHAFTTPHYRYALGIYERRGAGAAPSPSPGTAPSPGLSPNAGGEEMAGQLIPGAGAEAMGSASPDRGLDGAGELAGAAGGGGEALPGWRLVDDDASTGIRPAWRTSEALPGWRLADDDAGWEPNGQLASTGAAGGWRAVGNDPFLVSPPLALPLGEVAGIEVRMRARLDSGDLATAGEVYWVVEGEAGFSPEHRRSFVVRADGRPRTYRIALTPPATPPLPQPDPGEVADPAATQLAAAAPAGHPPASAALQPPAGALPSSPQAFGERPRAGATPISSPPGSGERSGAGAPTISPPPALGERPGEGAVPSPADALLTRLRLDPLPAPGEIVIESIRLISWREVLTAPDSAAP